MSENPFVFTPDNAEVVKKFARSNPAFKNALNSSTHWNKITVKNGRKLEKEVVLRVIVNFVYPEFLFPVLYQECDDDTYFLFRNGFSAVMMLLNRKLCLFHPETNENIELEITAHYKSFEEEPFDSSKEFSEAVKKRISGEYIVDLRNFRADPGMKSMFCDFQSITFVDVLLACIDRHIHSEWEKCSLLLSNNGILKLDCLSSLSHKQLAVLDLRNNQLSRKSFNEIPPDVTANHILIDGNPITLECTSVTELIRYIQRRLNIKMMDFIPLNTDAVQPIPSYIRKPSHIQFVDHFMYHYFGVFSTDMAKLKDMYHDDATLSITLFKNMKQRQPNVTFLDMAISQIDRNLLLSGTCGMYVPNVKYDNVFQGIDSVGEGLQNIPKSEIDYSSMTVDSPLNEEHMVIISCNGKIKASSNKVHLFSKVCVLVPLTSTKGEWKIANDMWTIINAPVPVHTFVQPILEEPTNDFAAIMNPQITDKRILTRIVKNLTKMKPTWVEKFLDEADWDLEFALQSFTDQLKADIISIEAFEIPPENLRLLSPFIETLKKKQVQLMSEGQVF